ncbi:hypothetical protein [Dyella mobilis]|uniref:SnoaL-like domain-containing protein n=1 Tax=Dyella mobilis TaxID=1849582 RepID=A0ABS2KAG9_9GAMM|nr:hypothetical protein [Dyella mobilis]MBM7128154.1 hypothetical protein [Dyella mobilis]
MKHVLLAVGLAFAGSAHAAAAPNADIEKATQQIQQVVHDFQAGIIKKDRALLASLFYPGSNSWFSVATAPAYRAMQQKFPGTTRVHGGSYEDFIGFVTGNPDPQEEKFSNVMIHTDGNIAAVYFDFVYLDKGKLNNQGSETWQLLNTPDGWKINSIIYTMDPGVSKKD